MSKHSEEGRGRSDERREERRESDSEGRSIKHKEKPKDEIWWGISSLRFLVPLLAESNMKTWRESYRI